jgi:hypothetical protein
MFFSVTYQSASIGSLLLAMLLLLLLLLLLPMIAVWHLRVNAWPMRQSLSKLVTSTLNLQVAAHLLLLSPHFSPPPFPPL